jgi:threonine dehydrogenase-like Zn-dependent dehydrogenase
VPATSIVPIPDGVSDEEAAWMGMAKIVQVGVRMAEHIMGDNVVLIGMGLLGQMALQYTKLIGCDQIIVIDTAPMRLEMARKHGATTVINATAAQAKEEVKKLTDGKGADVVYDITGHPAVLPTAFPLARRLGKVILLGDAGQPSQQVLSREVLTQGLKLIGVHDSLPPQQPTDHVRWSTMQMYSLFMRYVQRGQMNVKDLITHRFKPEDARKAYDLLNTDRQSVMGVMFEWA